MKDYDWKTPAFTLGFVFVVGLFLGWLAWLKHEERMAGCAQGEQHADR